MSDSQKLKKDQVYVNKPHKQKIPFNSNGVSQNQQQSIDQLQKEYQILQFEKRKYDVVIMLENQLFYYNRTNVENQNKDKFQIQGKLYKTVFDKNENPQFIIQEGTFDVDLGSKKFELNGEGIEYYGKSKTIKFKGKFINGNYQLNQPVISTKQGNRSKTQVSRIIIREVNQVIRNVVTSGFKSKFQYQNCWCKYNQQINQRDEQLLQNKGWLTSSIIDSFVLYLNMQSEKQYFNKNEDERKQTKRVLFLPTSLTTNFGIQCDQNKAQNLFQEELLQFEEMNFQLQKIYTRIGFPINQKNTHWVFVLFDFEKQQLEIFDSLRFNSIDSQLIKILKSLLKLENCIEKKSDYSGKQNNGYACGYYVCSFMEYIFNLQFKQQNQKFEYNETNIIKQLIKVIKDNQ